ncbi:MBL fold metallo-hydrolase [Corynebacterium uberis]|uniref:MBL fold metallo-hydrolase n=1 Tax=Corynebacterium TaxID=1716 RepID=UPI001D0AB8F7|nr:MULTISPECIES: MBL fold metallo-hydrolase [Corynebacterium]MCZ9310220.1 MBL fold metallo-hydrolase [Corynebacterium sp. c6VSa_13]UDL73696.1 MBL fold metallo-hydrolase [Corynebacterium uberis]UDL75422.1 MBL fold metallo-hydrolase [Corynebacterium uberis]UDL77635.1 MBL fold metallo-hydrolase [Corynebacterium uberis]UDL79920.1 MBL fold metallo-hydrolase [Corynebacterium uberis]
MKVTILGSSGSLGSPDNPASGYLLEAGGMPGLIMDLGPGALARLQTLTDPATCHVALSHLHADHCLDFPSLMVWRRFHPTHAARTRSQLLGPGPAPVHLGRLSADDQPDGIDDCSDTFEFTAWEDGRTHHLDALSITPYRAVHPVEAYSLRIVERDTGACVVYSGDSGWTPNLVTAAAGADVFLCEANWGATSQGKAPDMHLCGAEAGTAARLAGVGRLVIVHVPPWEDPEDAVAAARREFDGPVEFGAPGATYTTG